MPSLRLPSPAQRSRRPWLGSLLLLAALVAGALWVASSARYAVGYVRDMQPVEGTEKYVLELSPLGPGLNSFYVIAEKPTADLLGHWVLAHGTPLSVSKTEALLNASVVESLPFVHGGILNDGQRVIGDLGLLASAHGVGALVLGFILLVLGFLPLRLVAAGLLGALFGSIAWHVTVVGLSEGWFHADSGVASVVFLGFGALGAVLGLRRGGVLSELAQRGALLFVLLAIAPALSAQFGWSLPVAQVVAVGVSLLSRSAGLVVLIGFLLAAGLEATLLGSYLAMAGVALAIHLALGGRWFDLLNSLRGPRRSGADGVHIRLKDMVYA